MSEFCGSLGAPELIEKKGLRWRLLNMLALPWFIWLVFCLFALIWLGYNMYTLPLHSNNLSINFINLKMPVPGLLRLLVLTAIAGGLGAILRQVYNVSYQVLNRQFRRALSIDILMTPFIGFLGCEQIVRREKLARRRTSGVRGVTHNS